MTTKEKIIESAANLFAQNGYAGTGIREIAASVGIKDSSIYNHFSSKQEILEHLISMYIAKVDETMDMRINQLDTVECVTIENIMDSMFFSFEYDEAKFYTKILKIILHEQYRDKMARKCAKYHIIYLSQMRIKKVLDTLIRMGTIEMLDTLLFSKMLCCVLVSFSVEYAHGMSVDDIAYCDSNMMFDVLRYALANVIQIKPRHSEKAQQSG